MAAKVPRCSPLTPLERNAIASWNFEVFLHRASQRVAFKSIAPNGSHQTLEMPLSNDAPSKAADLLQRHFLASRSDSASDSTGNKAVVS